MVTLRLRKDTYLRLRKDTYLRLRKDTYLRLRKYTLKSHDFSQYRRYHIRYFLTY